MLCICSQIFPISSKHELADVSLPSNSKGVGGGSLITTPLVPKSRKFTGEASWRIWLAPTDFVEDDVTTFSFSFTQEKHTIHSDRAHLGDSFMCYFLVMFAAFFIILYFIILLFSFMVTA